MSFDEITEAFEAHRLNDEEQWRKVRLIAYETWRHGAKNAPSINDYLPIGHQEEKKLSDDEVAEMRRYWEENRKLNRKIKRKKLFKKNVTART